MITLNCIYVTLYFYKNMFNVSIIRIKNARSTIGYSEVAYLSSVTRTSISGCSFRHSGHQWPHHQTSFWAVLALQLDRHSRKPECPSECVSSLKPTVRFTFCCMGFCPSSLQGTTGSPALRASCSWSSFRGWKSSNRRG